MNNKNIDFIGKRKVFFIISAVLIAVSIIASFFCLKIAIEFKGGTIISYSYTGEVDTSQISKTIEDIVGSSVNVQQGELFNSDKLSLTVSFTSNEGITSSIQEEICVPYHEFLLLRRIGTPISSLFFQCGFNIFFDTSLIFRWISTSFLNCLD